MIFQRLKHTKRVLKLQTKNPKPTVLCWWHKMLSLPDLIVLLFVANKNDGAEWKAIKMPSALLCAHACECICAHLHLKQPWALLAVFVSFFTMSNLSKPSPLQHSTSAAYLPIWVCAQPVVSIPVHTPTKPLSRKNTHIHMQMDSS